MNLFTGNPMRARVPTWGRIPAVLALVAGLALASGCSKEPVSAADSSRADQKAEAAGGAISPAAAAISPAAAKAAGIEVMLAGPARIRTALTLYGTIRPNAEREQDVRARFPGVVRSVSKRAGDPVRQGEELLTVESNESLQTYSIRSQLNGRLLDRKTNPGDAVDSNTVLMRVADLSTMWVEFSVFARDLDHVRPGMSVLIHSADEDANAEGRISYVAPTGETDSQSVTARAAIDNQDGHWVAGQFVTGGVVIGDARVPVAILPAALQELQGKAVVFVQRGDRFEPRVVELGRRSTDVVEILEGLDAGDRYAARNSYLIKADLLKSETAED
ncbi:MAG TPA: efflux RND transporter periplasmic adaptor subunit [Steroidobacteraceae bacterium]|nr:efflux RND transporter periplasmic adaptor subunit [Steroidobacteraceae bacterium]